MYSLSDETMIRPEENGALLLQRQSMETCMLSSEGLITLRDICNGKQTKGDNAGFVDYLSKKGFISNGKTEISEESINILGQCIEESRNVKAPLRSLSVPESIHIYVSNVCDISCAGCYYRSSADNPVHFMEEELFDRIVSDAKKAKVFQVALGGGEPLLHPEILNMVSKIVKAGMICTMTTNGNKLDVEMAKSLRKAGLSKVQVSMNGDTEAINSLTRPNFKSAVNAIENARQAGLKTGINYVVTKQNIKRFPNLLKKAEEWECDSFNLLRPKEAFDDFDWLISESPGPEEFAWLQQRLKELSPKSRVKVRFDDAFSFLVSDQNPDELYENGIWGCVAARRFLNIDPFGNIYACSHVRETDVGNGDFLLAWRESKTLERFRTLDEDIEGKCAACSFRKCCRGCRAVVLAYGEDFISEDFQCPLDK